MSVSSSWYKPKKIAPINSLFNVDGWVGDYFFTRDRRLIAVIELDGYDADSLGPDEHYKFARLADSIYSNLDLRITVTQYYINYTGAQVALKRRDNAFNDTLSQSRVTFLNQQNLTSGRLYQFIEIELNNDLNVGTTGALFRNLVGALTDPEARLRLKQKLKYRDAVLLSRSDLKSKQEALQDAVEAVLAGWSMLMEGRVLTRASVNGVLSYFATFDSSALNEKKSIPMRDGGTYLAEGDISPVMLGNQAALKCDKAVPCYLRVCSVISLGKQPLPGFWFLGNSAVGNRVGNFIIMYRFTRMSKLEESMFFSSSEQDLARRNLNLVALATGKDMDYQEKRARMSEDVRQKLKELDQAKAETVSWSNTQCMILVHAETADKLRDEAKGVTASLVHSEVKHVWESVGLSDAYAAFLPSGRNAGVRTLKTNSRQNAVASLFYKPDEGPRQVEDLKDEAQFIFQTPSGRPFYYSPYVGGRGLTIGIGPTRSGKTYLKNTVASHFLKYGGELVDIDIDPGSEIIAKALGEKGGIVSIGSQAGGGFNLFSTYRGGNDPRFVAHLTQQLMRMLKANDEPSMQVLAPGEQSLLDQGIDSTLRLPPEFHTLSHLMSHLPPELQAKFQRWVRADRQRGEGKYSAFSDAIEDQIEKEGVVHKVYNLQSIKEDPHQLAIAYPEIFFRIIRHFESPEFRHIAKGLQIDECHHPLKDPSFVDQIVGGVRTWNKYKVMLALWTQSPEELKKLEYWDAVRSAASTFIFMADPGLSESLYRETFKITPGEIEAIRSLRPRQEAYIIQRDINVSKKIILNNDALMNATATSHPDEVIIRDQLVEEHGFERGIRLAAEGIHKINDPLRDSEFDSLQLDIISNNFYN